MRFLLSNDDGVFAPGLQAMAEALASLGEVTVVAPDAERSAFSSALTLDRPLRPQRLANGFISLNGTPADARGARGVQHGWFGVVDVSPTT